MKWFGYLLVFLGIVLAIALFVTNGGMSEGDVVRTYWYVLLICAVFIFGGGFLTILEK
jgi:hypothetical protein